MNKLSTRTCLVLVSILAIGQSGCEQSPLFERKETLAVPQVADGALDIVTTNGTIEAIESDRSDVQIVATIHAESEARAQAIKIVTERRPDQTLAVRVEWPDGRARGGEGCDFEILIPAANGVALTTDNGRLSTAGLAGAANLQSSNGAIEVNGHAGPVTAVTSNGQVKVTGATSSVKAEAMNGTIDVALAPESSGPVELKTTNGLVDLAVGPGFAGKLTLATTVGAISVDESVGAQRVASGSHQVELVFGPAEQQSLVSTVVGTVHVGTVNQ